MNKHITEEHITTNTVQTVSLGSVDDWSLTNLRKICRRNKVPHWATMDKPTLVAEVRKILDKMKDKTAEVKI